jgi:hypothetical protein
MEQPLKEKCVTQIGITAISLLLQPVTASELEMGVVKNSLTKF